MTPEQEPYVPQCGHRVTVQVTGTFIYRKSDASACLLFDNGTNVVLPPDTTWTRLPDPEPEWKPGDNVVDANNSIFQRITPTGLNNVWKGFCGLYKDSEVVRPLTELVRKT